MLVPLTTVIALRVALVFLQCVTCVDDARLPLWTFLSSPATVVTFCDVLPTSPRGQCHTGDTREMELAVSGGLVLRRRLSCCFSSAGIAPGGRALLCSRAFLVQFPLRRSERNARRLRFFLLTFSVGLQCFCS